MAGTRNTRAVFRPKSALRRPEPYRIAEHERKRRNRDSLLQKEQYSIFLPKPLMGKVVVGWLLSLTGNPSFFQGKPEWNFAPAIVPS
jgi:hypothetical protein